MMQGHLVVIFAGILLLQPLSLDYEPASPAIPLSSFWVSCASQVWFLVLNVPQGINQLARKNVTKTVSIHFSVCALTEMKRALKAPTMEMIVRLQWQALTEGMSLFYQMKYRK